MMVNEPQPVRPMPEPANNNNINNNRNDERAPRPPPRQHNNMCAMFEELNDNYDEQDPR
jgi:hypothetical protein